jgi:hypothetical protein
VVEGETSCGDVRCPPGTHIALDEGDTLGRSSRVLTASCSFEVMMGDPRSFPADSAGSEALLSARGLGQLPNPPIAMPHWLEDTRS